MRIKEFGGRPALCWIAACIALASVTSPALADKGGCRGFAGTWDSSFGPIPFTVHGNTARGAYTNPGGTIEATIAGSVMTGKWIQRDRSGGLRFVLADDGNSFKGTWTEANGGGGGAWNGSCAGPPPAPTEVSAGFGWRGIDITDCTAGDIGETRGGLDPGRCGPHSKGIIAVCWDGSTHRNGSGAWCTYKSTPAKECRGGSNPGVAYECQPLGERMPIDDVVLPGSAAGCRGFAGIWDSSFGKIPFTVQGSNARGSYTNPAGTIEASIAGKVLTGKWIQSDRSGGLRFVLADDGNSFTGTWTEANGGGGGAWNGTCAGPARAELSTGSGGFFDGAWHTDGWGPMTIRQIGNEVSGSYVMSAGTFRGRVQGSAMRFSWKANGTTDAGEAYATMTVAGFEGRWCRPAGCDPTNGIGFKGWRP